MYSGKDAVTYSVINETGECLIKKESRDGVFNTSTEAYEIKLDFSEIKEAGSYAVKVGEETSVFLELQMIFIRIP